MNSQKGEQMVHQYKNNGYNIVLDVNSGSVHVVDEMVYDMIPYYKEKGREATIDEISESLHEDPVDIVIALDSMRSPVSIFEPIYNDGGDTIYLCDQIEDQRLRKKDIDINIALDDAIRDLESREKYIIDQRYIIGKTQMEIANELGISQAQISRLEKNAIKTLKKVLR